MVLQIGAGGRLSGSTRRTTRLVAAFATALAVVGWYGPSSCTSWVWGLMGEWGNDVSLAMTTAPPRLRA